MAYSYVIVKPLVEIVDGSEVYDYKNDNIVGAVRLWRSNNGTRSDKAFLILEGAKQSGSDLDVADLANVNTLINNEFVKRGINLSQFNVTNRFSLDLFLPSNFINKYPG